MERETMEALRSDAVWSLENAEGMVRSYNRSLTIGDAQDSMRMLARRAEWQASVIYWRASVARYDAMLASA